MSKVTGRRRRRWPGWRSRAGELRVERVTVGLAALALVPALSLIAGELRRSARRRRESGETDELTNFADVAELATRDALTVASQGIRATPHHESVLFNILQGFLGAFAIVRLSTWGIRRGWWPAGNVRVSGRHIHHFVPGIVLAFGSGTAALITRSERVESALALPFGAGMGLTLDEAALLLDLRDVYWTRQGLLSVQVSLGVTATLAATILGLRILRRGEERGVEEGLIPEVDGHEIRAAGALA